MKLPRGIPSRVREGVDDGLDWLRYRIDSFPSRPILGHASTAAYQPLPELGKRVAGRAEGSESRLAAIVEALDRYGISSGTALDLGANNAYFSIALARKGFSSVAVESSPPSYRTAIYAIRRAKLVDKVAVTVSLMTPQNIAALPATDVVLFLSLWHHFVREHGMDTALAMLEEIWAKTNRVLFFEMGEEETPAFFNLPPLEPDARTWITKLLEEHCAGGVVEHLGENQAFAPDQSPVMRSLFAVRRA
jgi:hypothetical protein